MVLPPGFDKALALEAGALVNQAYDQFDHFTKKQPWSLTGAYDTLGLFSAKPDGVFPQLEPFGFVARNQASRNVFVTFRGTISLGDWLSDFGFPQVPHPWGKAEQGFSRLYGQCSAAVKTAVQSAGPSPKVFVTGHSLGAGLAVLATADLVNLGAAMYSFAGPRVGDPAFTAQFNKSVAVAWRIVNTEDIVTTVPLATPQLLTEASVGIKISLLMKSISSLNYEHVGTPVSFTTNTGSIEGNHGMLQYLDAVRAS